MFASDVEITPTPEQQQLLLGPQTVSSLKAADFIGNQQYIDQWIVMWLTSTAWDSAELPLCISESIICDKQLQQLYKQHVCQALIENNIDWMQTHYIVPLTHIWSFVDFEQVSQMMFDFLWGQAKVPLLLGTFVAYARKLHQWRVFVDIYGPDACIDYAARQQWYGGLEYCVTEGAELKDIVKYCVRSAQLFRLVTLYNPEATSEAFEEFCLQRMLCRVEDVALVEEWFFVHGYKVQKIL